MSPDSALVLMSLERTVGSTGQGTTGLGTIPATAGTARAPADPTGRDITVASVALGLVSPTSPTSTRPAVFLVKSQ